ncbi:MAG: hypothetical protein IMZ50_08340 [Candidatus Atribacteria bacterium]|nr:hypothetical protein [Candidatus Atribacteria bacterium]
MGGKSGIVYMGGGQGEEYHETAIDPIGFGDTLGSLASWANAKNGSKIAGEMEYS